VHLKGVNSMAMSGLSLKNTLVGTGWDISLVPCINGPEQLLAESHNYCKLSNGRVYLESQMCRECYKVLV